MVIQNHKFCSSRTVFFSFSYICESGKISEFFKFEELIEYFHSNLVKEFLRPLTPGSVPQFECCPVYQKVLGSIYSGLYTGDNQSMFFCPLSQIKK